MLKITLQDSVTDRSHPETEFHRVQGGRLRSQSCFMKEKIPWAAMPFISCYITKTKFIKSNGLGIFIVVPVCLCSFV